MSAVVVIDEPSGDLYGGGSAAAPVIRGLPAKFYGYSMPCPPRPMQDRMRGRSPMGVPSLTLEALLKDIAAPVSAELAAVAPADVVLDSRLVKAGDLLLRCRASVAMDDILLTAR